jgi:hypothetical protein
MKAYFAIVIAATLPLVASADPSLEVVADASGVIVRRDRDGSPTRFVAEGRLPGTPAAVLEVLLDYEQQVNRFPRVAESRVLRRGAGLLFVYQRLRLPIVSDRDYTLRVRYGVEGERTWLRYETRNESGPAPRSGIVRAPENRGLWQLIPTADGRETRARFEMRFDLGGWIPGSLARGGTPRELVQLFERIREMLRMH